MVVNLCTAGLHDLSDPKNVGTTWKTGQRVCRPCLRAQGEAMLANRDARNSRKARHRKAGGQP